LWYIGCQRDDVMRNANHPRRDGKRSDVHVGIRAIGFPVDADCTNSIVNPTVRLNGLLDKLLQLGNRSAGSVPSTYFGRGEVVLLLSMPVISTVSSLDMAEKSTDSECS
jgi:hypothetical protein